MSTGRLRSVGCMLWRLFGGFSCDKPVQLLIQGAQLTSDLAEPRPFERFTQRWHQDTLESTGLGCRVWYSHSKDPASYDPLPGPQVERTDVFFESAPAKFQRGGVGQKLPKMPAPLWCCAQLPPCSRLRLIAHPCSAGGSHKAIIPIVYGFPSEPLTAHYRRGHRNFHESLIGTEPDNNGVSSAAQTNIDEGGRRRLVLCCCFLRCSRSFKCTCGLL